MDNIEKKFYTNEKAYAESLKYFNGDELSSRVFIDKYALRDENGRILEKDPSEMHTRLAKEFARIEKKNNGNLTFEKIFELFDNFKYVVPQGSPMSAIGNKYAYMTAGNCYVIEPPADSYSAILHTDQQLVNLMKRRAGVGTDISHIRPKNFPVKNAAKTTDGIGVFMERYSNTTREVAQSGRRGALLLSISIHHPDIRTFINIKKDKTKVTGANVSIRITDEFMNAVKNNEDFELRWPVNSKNPKYTEKISAKKLWDEIVESAWDSAEPGILFWDTMNKYSPAHVYGKIDDRFYNKSTNPCGEIVMGKDSCRLMLLNLFSYVKNKFTENSEFDFEKFASDVYDAQILMDDMIDLEIELMDRIIEKIKLDPEPENIKKNEFELWEDLKDVCLKGRRTGLGITALGDCLAALNVTYGSEKSIEITEKIYKTMCYNAYKSSCFLAKDRGKFPLYDINIDKESLFIQRLFKEFPDLEELHKQYGRRNISLLTTAPAGSVSILTKTTSGIEPAFLIEYSRRKKINSQDNESKCDFVDQNGDKWVTYKVYHHHFNTWKDITNKTNIEESPYHKSTSNDIDWVQSVKIQAAAQKWVDHSISKTCNIPNETSKETVSEIYLKAWEEGCKGFTIYRDGCRTGVLVKSEEKIEKIQKTNAPPRPKDVPHEVHHYTKKGYRYVVSVGFLHGDPYEVFINSNHDNDGEIIIPKFIKEGIVRKESRGKYVLRHFNSKGDLVEFPLNNGQCDPEMELIARMVSSNLRHGTDIAFVVHTLEKIPGDMFASSKVIARVLKKYIQDGFKVTGETVPDCKTPDQCSLVRQDGCIKCKNCGWNKCS